MNEGVALPLLIVSGFLGAGKTTLLQRALTGESWLASCRARGKLLLIVNDYAPDNVDAKLLGGSDVPPVELSGGCVCCNLLPQLLAALQDAAASGAFEYAILECTGLADATPIVAAILRHATLSRLVAIDAVLVVVDANTLAAAGCDDSEVERLRLEQLRGANVVVLNKMEDAFERHCARSGDIANDDDDAVDAAYRAFDRSLRERVVRASGNPRCRCYPTSYSNLALSDVVANRGFFGADACAPLFLAAAPAEGAQAPDEPGEAERLGVKSVLVVAAAPRVPKLADVLAALRDPTRTPFRGDVWRSKGFFFATEEPDATTKQFRWSSVGDDFQFGEVLPPFVALGGGADVVARVVFIGSLDVGDDDEEPRAAHIAREVFGGSTCEM